MKKIFFLILFLINLCPAVYAIENDEILKEKIAQMIMVGFNGQVLTATNPVYSDIQNLKVGGVILYSKSLDKVKTKLIKNIKDPRQLKKLTSDLQQISKIPLFIGIEQEGGFISPLSPSYFVISMYNAKTLGNINNIVITQKEAEKTAKTLSDVGINLNFAPCLDLEINKSSKLTALQRRSFSDNPNVVKQQAEIFIKANKKYNIISVPKYYPGIGSADNSKLYNNFLDITDTYTEEEITPFKEAIQLGIQGILLGHVYNKNIDKNYPLSLSEKSIQNNLKQKLNYKGLIFVDDIQNNAIMNSYAQEEILKRSILAGADVIIIGNNINYQEDSAKNAVEIIFNLVKNGTIKKERIDYSYDRIIEIKKSLKIENVN